MMMVNFKLQRQYKQRNRRNKHQDYRPFTPFTKSFDKFKRGCPALPYANKLRFEDENQSAIGGAIQTYVRSHNSKRSAFAYSQLKPTIKRY
jgi:hypothetical protein